MKAKAALQWRLRLSHSECYGCHTVCEVYAINAALIWTELNSRIVDLQSNKLIKHLIKKKNRAKRAARLTLPALLSQAVRNGSYLALDPSGWDFSASQQLEC